MSQFIMLTLFTNHSKVPINIREIQFSRKEEGKATQVNFIRGNVTTIYVEETPEEIYALIKEDSNEKG